MLCQEEKSGIDDAQTLTRPKWVVCVLALDLWHMGEVDGGGGGEGGEGTLIISGRTVGSRI
ncbi:hypothetical protein EYF80_037290 [Liparis tanakae]|uniref:Uncharacterized protein n=1 Tax=Liparis tanakae TaxID=230148 RepID=A0A4Z2GHY2_9TELE|nr:hypothetical protein EYF80_037290 [Liparis tanakae]